MLVYIYIYLFIYNIYIDLATRVYSISPKCGPASGGTIMSILGTGFRDTEHMKVHFTYGDQKNHVKEVPCDFDPKLKCLTCTTPKFEDTSEGDQHEEINFPQIVKVAITLDGVHYSYCEEDFLVYCNFEYIYIYIYPSL